MNETSNAFRGIVSSIRGIICDFILSVAIKVSPPEEKASLIAAILAHYDSVLARQKLNKCTTH